MDRMLPLLVVDDDEDNVNTLRIILEEEGYNVESAYTGMAAVEKFKQNDFATVLLDFRLPDIKGDEVAERIHRIDPGVGIILLTGYKHSINPSVLTSFIKVLEKPVQPAAIINAIKYAIRRETAPHEN